MKERLGEAGVSPVIATILMIVVTVIMASIIGVFAFHMGKKMNPAPYASITAKDRGVGPSIVMSHGGGDSLRWTDLKISVTKGVDSSTEFIAADAPADSTVFSEVQSGNYVSGDSVIIENESDGTPLAADTYYRVVLRHEPSGTVLLDANVLVTTPQY